MWLVIDVPNLAYRSYYALGAGLSHGGVGTSVAFGIFRTINDLTDRFMPKGVIWCFDEGRSKRAKIYPAYKQNRKRDEAFEQVRSDVMIQINALRDEHLADIGYRNIQSVEGYEADDLIAAAVLGTIPMEDYVVIVGTDSDLYQLLGPRVTMWAQSRGIINADWLKENYSGIDPMDWPTVKAIAGCSTDNIEGVRGVGEKTAARYLKGLLKPGKTLNKIVDSFDLISRNMQLVKLPFEGTPNIDVELDDFTPRRWSKVMKSLGMESLVL
jgi:DNA polymerase-1